MRSSRYRWFVVGVFFVFMLLHQCDKLLIGPLTVDIMNQFHITNTQMGAVFTGALIVGAIAYPLWGVMYDKYSRSKLLALASLLWGSTTWLSAIAPTYPLFVATRASTGIDDSSYPGLYSLIADYFGPKVRGKVYGFLQLTQPLGYLMGMVLALILGGLIGWRGVFYITGSLGIVLSVVIFFGVKEPERGQSEPEFENAEQVASYKFDWKTARDLFKKPSLLLLFTQGFFGVFPWNVITYWFFAYLEKERGYSSETILFTMAPAVLILAAGYPLGGALGDYLFSRTPRGRMIISTFGVITGAILLTITMNVPLNEPVRFTVMMCLAALFIPFASANVTSTVYDVTLPEVRSTAQATSSFIESVGAAAAPLVAGAIADMSSLHNAILILCLSAWMLCFVAFLGVIYFVPRDIAVLRQQMAARAAGAPSMPPVTLPGEAGAAVAP